MNKKWLAVEFDLWVDSDEEIPTDPLEFLDWFRADNGIAMFVDGLVVRDREAK